MINNTINPQSLTSTDINILVPDVGPPMTASKDTLVTIYTDGRCKRRSGPSGPSRGCVGPGGWACVMQKGSARKEIFGSEPPTTKNRMELLAAIRGLELLTKPSTVCIYSDSKYVIDGFTKGRHKWEPKGWRLKRGGPVKNLDLWLRLVKAAAAHRVNWTWVKAHSGNIGNDRACWLATQAALSGVPTGLSAWP